MATRKKSRENRSRKHWRCGSMMLMIELREAIWLSGLLTHQVAALTGLDEDVFRKGYFRDLTREQVLEATAALRRFAEEKRGVVL